MVGVKKVNIVITIPPFFVHTTPAIFFSWNQPRQRDAIFSLGANLNKGMPKILDGMMWEFSEEQIKIYQLKIGKIKKKCQSQFIIRPRAKLKSDFLN